MDKIKVLFLSANPVATPKLQLDEEIRQIGIKLRASEYRDAFEFIPRFAARPDDLLQALQEHKPQIVHFSGHGTQGRPISGPPTSPLPSGRDLIPQDSGQAGQLIFMGDRGQPQPVSQEALVHLFRILRDNVRVVVFNACYSLPLAEALAETIDCSIGMNQPIGDEAAIVFAASFYRALGFGRSVREAFELGKAALLLEGIPEDKTPELLTRQGVDDTRLILILPPAAAMSGAEESETKGRVGVPARLALVRDLSGLAPTDWACLVTSIEGAAAHVSHNLPIPEQVAQLVRWAESTNGPKLAAVEEAFKELRNP